ncbi:MAG: hypothetical protein ACI815_002286 [Psychroserpens sp.]|jgi:hypothetical protein
MAGLKKIFDIGKTKNDVQNIESNTLFIVGSPYLM